VAGNVIRFLPPLTVSDALLTKVSTSGCVLADLVGPEAVSFTLALPHLGSLASQKDSDRVVALPPLRMPESSGRMRLDGRLDLHLATVG